MKIEIVTFTNKGYIKFTENLVKSIIKNNIEINLKIFTLDKDSFDFFNALNCTVEMVDDEEFNLSNFVRQDEDIFGELMYKKLQVIYQSLIKNDYVLYVDGDITIKKNPTSYLVKKISDKDFLIQNDKNPRKPFTEYLCAGFMFIKSNEKTKKFFNPKNIPKEEIMQGNHDQSYINKHKNNFKYKLLPLRFFPNGAHYYRFYKFLNPYIIHFNYVLGEEKESIMKQHKEWYL